MSDRVLQQSTTLGLFRHGQTDWNIDFRLQGTTDTQLNSVGIAQVAAAAQLLGNLGSWDVLLSSPLTRAKQTSEILAAQLGFAQILETPLLIERSFGAGEGLTYDEWQQHYASLDEIPGAETASEVLDRSRQLLALIESDFAGKRVLAVTHGALIRYVLNLVSDGKVPPPGERLQNTSLHLVHHTQGSWSLEAWAPQAVAAIGVSNPLSE